MINIGNIIDEIIALSEAMQSTYDVLQKTNISYADALKLDSLTPIANQIQIVKSYLDGDFVVPEVDAPELTNVGNFTVIEESLPVEYDEDWDVEEEDEPEEIFEEQPKSLFENIDDDEDSFEDDDEIEDEDDIEWDEPICTEPEPVKEKRNYSRRSDDEVIKIIDYICEKYDGKKITDVAKKIEKEFDLNCHTAQRLVNQETYKHISGIKYDIVNGKIKVIKPVIEDYFTHGEDDIPEIRDMLMSEKGDLISVIGPNMSKNDCVKLAMARLMLYNKDVFDTIGGGVKEILLMNIISEHRDANIEEIKEMFTSKFNLDVDGALVSSVKNGRSYKEIWQRFE